MGLVVKTDNHEEYDFQPQVAENSYDAEDGVQKCTFHDSESTYVSVFGSQQEVHIHPRP